MANLEHKWTKGRIPFRVTVVAVCSSVFEDRLSSVNNCFLFVSESYWRPCEGLLRTVPKCVFSGQTSFYEKNEWMLELTLSTNDHDSEYISFFGSNIRPSGCCPISKWILHISDQDQISGSSICKRYVIQGPRKIESKIIIFWKLHTLEQPKNKIIQ